MLASLVSIGSHALPGAVKGADTAVSYSLARQGFNAAGPNAIGIVAFPQSQLVRAVTTGNLGKGPFLPESRIVFGHTAVYVRVGGRIRAIRSYASESMVEAALNFDKMRSGAGGVPARIIDHLGEPFPPGGRMFDITSGRSIEYPVPKEMAIEFLSKLPEGGPLPGALYTAQPEVAAQLGQARLGKGQNCVHWAVSEVEAFLWTPMGPSGTSLKDLPAPDAARQRKTMDHLQLRAPDRLIRLRNGEEVKPVRGSMPVRLKAFKWGYRLFSVAMVCYTAFRLWKARPHERLEVIVEEVGDFAGGTLGAKVALGLCHGLSSAGHEVGQLFCGIAGGVLGSISGLSAGDAISRRARRHGGG